MEFTNEELQCLLSLVHDVCQGHITRERKVVVQTTYYPSEVINSLHDKLCDFEINRRAQLPEE